jgi:nucleoside-diphosphate-sugar epimerase
MSTLIGSTGFVGGHLQRDFEFTHKYNRANISEIQGLKTDLLICAGLPAEKWKANSDPEADWSNMANLAQNISSVSADKAILISTIDVYQPPVNVNETNLPELNGIEGYGRNRSWFEQFFKSQFENSTILRLPGLFGTRLKKNLIFDLLNNREDQIAKVNANSEFQFFDISLIGQVINMTMDKKIALLNVATEPLIAQEIGNLFGKELNSKGKVIQYNMRSIHADGFQGKNGYLYSSRTVLEAISRLIDENDL